MNNFYVHVVGCQQNQHDGVRIAYLLEKLGMTPSDAKEADLIVAVACSVRQSAVDRIYGNVKNWLKSSPVPPTILLTGCVLDYDKKKFKKKNVFFWDIEKPEELAGLLRIKNNQLVENLLEEGRKAVSSVPIMFGCNNFCTYCATKITRGREHSRKISEVVINVKNLINSGSKEILLLGQTIDSYKDPETGVGLDRLFHKLNNLEGDFVISFTSNHPKDMTDDIIEAVATLPKIKKEIHLPVQSGSDKILKAMNRPYTISQYLKLVGKIRQVSKKYNTEIDITTDIIVGFPGETEEDFQDTVNVFKKVGYKMAYINKYSPRRETAAFQLGDPIPWSEKKRRWKILDDLLKNSAPKHL